MITIQQILWIALTVIVTVSTANLARPERQSLAPMSFGQGGENKQEIDHMINNENSASERQRRSERSPHTARSLLRIEHDWQEADLEGGLMPHDKHEDGRRQLARRGNYHKVDKESDLKGGVMALYTQARQSNRRTNRRNDADPESDLTDAIVRQERNRHHYHQIKWGRADNEEYLTGGQMQHNSPRMQYLRSSNAEKNHSIKRRDKEGISGSERHFLEEKQSEAERKLHATPVVEANHGHRRRRDQGMLTGLGDAQQGVDVQGLTSEERHRLEKRADKKQNRVVKDDLTKTDFTVKDCRRRDEGILTELGEAKKGVDVKGISSEERHRLEEKAAKSAKRRKRNSSPFRMGRSVYQDQEIGLGNGYKSADVQGLTNGERKNLEEQDEREGKEGTITIEVSKKRLSQAHALEGDGTLSEEIGVGEDGMGNQHMLNPNWSTTQSEPENLAVSYLNLHSRHHTMKKERRAAESRTLYQNEDGKIGGGANAQDEHTRMVSEHLNEKRRHKKREAVSRKLIQAESGWLELNNHEPQNQNIQRINQMVDVHSSKQKRSGAGVLYEAENGKLEGGANAQNEHIRMVSEHLSQKRSRKYRRESANIDFLDRTGGTEDERMSESNFEHHFASSIKTNDAGAADMEAKKERKHDTIFSQRRIRDAPVHSVGTKLIFESGDLSAIPNVANQQPEDDEEQKHHQVSLSIPSASHHPISKRDGKHDGAQQAPEQSQNREPAQNQSHIDDDLIEDILHLEGL